MSDWDREPLPRRPRPQPGEPRHQQAPRRRAPARPYRYDPATYEPLPENKAADAARGAGEWVVIIVVALCIAFFVQRFIVQTFEIPSGSMIPTLQVGDRVLANKIGKHFGAVDKGDVVVFDPPPTETDPSVERLIKRVIATGGDRVEARDGLVFVNGKPLQEPYLPSGTSTTMRPVTVPEGTLWMMGDNRGDSKDSRFIGPIDEDLVVGVAFIKIWPLTDVGLL